MSSVPNNADLPPLPLRLEGSEPNPAQSPPSQTPANQTPANQSFRSPLCDADFKQIEQCSKRARPIQKAIRYANFSGWTLLLGGAGSLIFALSNPPMMVFALVIAGLGTRELTLRRALIQLEPKALSKLAINQLFIGGALIAYAIYTLAFAPSQTMIESAMESDPTISSTPELAGMMDDLIALEQMATMLIYIAMIVIAFVVQGSTAIYYLRKKSKLKSMLTRTPDWVIRAYRAAHS